jgi:hypothetical protein
MGAGAAIQIWQHILTKTTKDGAESTKSSNAGISRIDNNSLEKAN